MERLVSSVRLDICYFATSGYLDVSKVLAGALLEQSEALLDRGIHPIRIADGFDRACAIAVQQLDRISDRIEFSKDNTTNLLKAAMTSLGSKMSVVFVFCVMPSLTPASVSRRKISSLHKSLSMPF
jgi:hypothetical protein